MLVDAGEGLVARKPFAIGHDLKCQLISDIDLGVIARSPVRWHLSRRVL